LKDNAISRVSLGVGLAACALVIYDIGLRQGEARRQVIPLAAASHTVTAQEFVLVDDKAQIRAKLAVAKGKPGLAIYGKDSGTPRVVLAVTSDGTPLFAMLDKDGLTPRASIEVSDKQDGAASFRVYDKEGKLTWSSQ